MFLMNMEEKTVFPPRFEHMTFDARVGRSATWAILPKRKVGQNVWFIFIMGKLPLPFPTLRE